MIGVHTNAQEGFKSAKVFVRVYDLQANKIAKGKIFSITEDALYLVKRKDTSTIPVSTIGKIKTKHSGGNNVLMGAATGAALFAILGIASADPDSFLGYTVADGAFGGAVVGGISGSAIRAITILFKNSETYEINGDAMHWKAFTESLRNK